MVRRVARALRPGRAGFTPEDVLVAEDAGGAPVGFAQVAADDGRGKGEIALMAVRPDRQGEGIGLALGRAALDRLRDRGARVVEVGTGADPAHAAARRLYRRLGFDHPIRAVWLYRTL